LGGQGAIRWESRCGHRFFLKTAEFSSIVNTVVLGSALRKSMWLFFRRELFQLRLLAFRNTPLGVSVPLSGIEITRAHALYLY
jgi:hypothetical protein